jgi:hypothetical protein
MPAWTSNSFGPESIEPKGWKGDVRRIPEIQKGIERESRIRH